MLLKFLITVRLSVSGNDIDR